MFDPVADGRVPAVVLRMPRGRAAWFGRVLDAYTRMCRLAGVELDAAEYGPAWALARAAASAGHVEPGARVSGQVTSGRRMRVAAVLREVEAARVALAERGQEDAARLLREAWETSGPGGFPPSWSLLAADRAEGLPS